MNLLFSSPTKVSPAPITIQGWRAAGPAPCSHLQEEPKAVPAAAPKDDMDSFFGSSPAPAAPKVCLLLGAVGLQSLKLNFCKININAMHCFVNCTNLDCFVVIIYRHNCISFQVFFKANTSQFRPMTSQNAEGQADQDLLAISSFAISSRIFG